jgi:hypothetical protein
MFSVNELKTKEKEIAAKINAIESGEEGLRPVVDGIMHIEDYVKAKYKILWILKEVNDSWVPDNKEPGGKRCGGWNLTCAGEDTPQGLYERIIKEPKSIYKFVAPRRIMLASYCIFAGTIDVIKNRNEAEMFKALSSIAYINVKKIPGGSKADNIALQQACNNYNSILEDQIKTYNPDVIICGNTLSFFPSTTILKRPKNRKKTFSPNSGSKYCYYPLADKLYINTYHPSHKSADKEFWYKRIEEIVNAVSDWENNFREK